MINWLQENTIFVLLTAIIIVCALAAYAAYLLIKLKQQQTKQDAFTQERKEKVTESIQTIAAATLQQQCNLSEASIRVVKLLAIFDEDEVKLATQYKAVYSLYDKVKDMPTHDDRKKLERTELEELDVIREEHEAEHEAAILSEMKILQQYSLS